MALAPPLQSTVNDDLFTGLKRTQDLSAMQLNYEPAVRGALANSLADNANKRQMAISQQNADTARFAAEQEARALDKSIDMNRTALPFQLAQQAFGAQGLLPWLFGGTSGQGAGATTYPGLINQAGGALNTIGSGLSNAINSLTGGGGSALQPNPFADAERQGLEEAGATAEAGGSWGIGGTPTDWLQLGAQNLPGLISGAGDTVSGVENLLGDLNFNVSDWFSNLGSSDLDSLLGKMDWGQNSGIESVLGDWNWQDALPDLGAGTELGDLVSSTTGDWGIGGDFGSENWWADSGIGETDMNDYFSAWW